MSTQSTRRVKWATVAALVALAPFAGGTAALAVAGDSAAKGPVHKGDPRRWGPPLEKVCSSPDYAKSLGYNVILGGPGNDTIIGTPKADAIFSFEGDDGVRGRAGDDVICLGKGFDKGIGDGGNDAVFGEWDDDSIAGAKGRDYLNGGDGKDRCDGGPQLDAAQNCEWVINVP
jgi:Ca2+-binding RTX toxin-like protein